MSCFVECLVWIGGSDQITGSEFLWSKSGNKITSTRWSLGEPNSQGENEDCIDMFASNGKWNDESCASTIQFICEKKHKLIHKEHI